MTDDYATDAVAGWPPAPRPHDTYRDLPVNVDGHLRMRTLRKVLLWGGKVHVDGAGRVHCPGCNELVDAVELGQPGNPHRVGLPFRDGTAAVPPAAFLPVDQLGPLFARIDAALTDGCSIGQAMEFTGTSEEQVRRVKAIRDRRQAPPPNNRAPQPWETGW
ncbi:hypothetical protein AB0873_09520 [Micromonospora sp. NPDC047707]|uniref:hypothetical protein n=1 Tax=Micromonospora sp. NPDC047707 TaxID=3154498 RepID=UPI003451CD9C